MTPAKAIRIGVGHIKRNRDSNCDFRVHVWPLTEHINFHNRGACEFSVTSKISPNIFKSCPKNDFTTKIKDFDTFTKIVYECRRFG